MRYLIFISFLFFSCEDEYADLIESEIPEEIRPYYDLFYEEARSRGVHLEEVPVRIVIVDNLGYGALTYRKKRLIQINSPWVTAAEELPFTALNLEHLIFHELGHYVLDRRHLTDTFPNGKPVSMMHGHERAYSAAFPEDREYYIDELFSTHTK